MCHVGSWKIAPEMKEVIVQDLGIEEKNVGNFPKKIVKKVVIIVKFILKKMKRRGLNVNFKNS